VQIQLAIAEALQDPALQVVVILGFIGHGISPWLSIIDARLDSARSPLGFCYDDLWTSIPPRMGVFVG